MCSITLHVCLLKSLPFFFCRFCWRVSRWTCETNCFVEQAGCCISFPIDCWLEAFCLVSHGWQLWARSMSARMFLTISESKKKKKFSFQFLRGLSILILFECLLCISMPAMVEMYLPCSWSAVINWRCVMGRRSWRRNPPPSRANILKLEIAHCGVYSRGGFWFSFPGTKYYFHHCQEARFCHIITSCKGQQIPHAATLAGSFHFAPLQTCAFFFFFLSCCHFKCLAVIACCPQKASVHLPFTCPDLIFFSCWALGVGSRVNLLQFIIQTVSFPDQKQTNM